MHDAVRFSEGLGAKLSSRSRHVCALLGAGASKACGLPDIAALQSAVLSALEGAERTPLERHFAAGRNLEQALSRIRRIAVLLDGGTGEIDGLDDTSARTLDEAVCRAIVKQLVVDSVSLEPMLRFAAWAGQADHAQPLEIFSVNYDLLVETALERLGVPYFDGFSGALRARFRPELVEATAADPADWLPAFLVRVWKLHGSVNWAWEEGERAEVVRLGVPVESGTPAAIYPSDAKYDESRRVPFLVLQDRFRRALRTPETLVLVAGFSWGDAHLNEMLLDTARRRPRTEIVSFAFGELPEAIAASAESLPNLQLVGRHEAVVSGIRGSWTRQENPLAHVAADDTCLLGDFGHLAAFLATGGPSYGEQERRIAEILGALANADV